MNYSMIKVLMLKDWYLQRWFMLAALLGGVISLGIVCLGGQAAFTVGLILLVTVLVAVGGQLAVGSIVQERKDQTLAFVMSLPISFRDYTTSKLLGTLLIFLVPWLLLVLGCLTLFAVPNGIPHGLLPFTVIMSVEILVSACLQICMALVTESQGWTVCAVIVGNLALNFFGYYVAHVASIAKGMGGHAVMWSPAASVLLLTESGVIGLLLGVTFFIQGRKKEFL